MEHMLFRIHKQADDKYTRDIVLFIKGYFYMNNEKCKVAFSEFMGYDGQGSPNGKMYDVVIHTSDENKAKIAHAAGWSYIAGQDVFKSKVMNLYKFANVTFHGNKKFADELSKVKELFE